MGKRVLPNVAGSLFFLLFVFDASRYVASFGVTSFVRRFANYKAETAPVTALWGKKSKRKGSGGQGPPQEKQSVQDARFDAMTRQFMFTLVGLTKRLPDKSKDILQDINLSFYPGAKIGGTIPSFSFLVIFSLFSLLSFYCYFSPLSPGFERLGEVDPSQNYGRPGYRV